MKSDSPCSTLANTMKSSKPPHPRINPPPPPPSVKAAPPLEEV